MVDEPSSRPQQGAPTGAVFAPTSPPMHSASHFLVGMNAVELQITFGQTRLVFARDSSRHEAMVEWIASFALSPQAAKQVSLAVSEAVEAYEKQYGKIQASLTGAQRSLAHKPKVRRR